MTIDKKTGILSGVLSLVAGAGAVGYYFYNKHNQDLLKEKKDIKIDDKHIDFEEQKERVINMIDESRKKFSQNHTPPSKHTDKKSFIHNQNHNLKASTKRVR